MIGYLTLGTPDLDRAGKFHDALLASLGAKRVMTTERTSICGTRPGSPMRGVCTPHDGQPATAGNGTLVREGVALDAGSKAVRTLHQQTLDLGAQDEGAPGPRNGACFGGHFRDPVGNKFVFHTIRGMK